MNIFVGMFIMYMLCVSSDISHRVLYFVLYYVGLQNLISFACNRNSDISYPGAGVVLDCIDS